jgi:hypothetical protein
MIFSLDLIRFLTVQPQKSAGKKLLNGRSLGNEPRATSQPDSTCLFPVQRLRNVM